MTEDKLLFGWKIMMSEFIMQILVFTSEVPVSQKYRFLLILYCVICRYLSQRTCCSWNSQVESFMTSNFSDWWLRVWELGNNNSRCVKDCFIICLSTELSTLILRKTPRQLGVDLKRKWIRHIARWPFLRFDKINRNSNWIIGFN